MNTHKKYGRSLHAPISLGTTSDDRFMPKGYLEAFAQKKQLVLTEKLDGQNNCLNKYGVFARSHASPSIHPWDKALRERWALIRHDLKDLEIFGENMYAVHSIGYRKLESYYYVFAIREKDRWLSWEEVKFYAAMLDFPVVPEIRVQVELSTLFDRSRDENEVLAEWLTENLGCTWEEFVDSSGQLGGFDPETGADCCEGLVVRDAEGFSTRPEELKVAANEFDRLFKLVRKAHVKTDVHWTKNWKPASLIDYQRYKWFGYAFNR